MKNLCQIICAQGAGAANQAIGYGVVEKNAAA